MAPRERVPGRGVSTRRDNRRQREHQLCQMSENLGEKPCCWAALSEALPHALCQPPAGCSPTCILRDIVFAPNVFVKSSLFALSRAVAQALSGGSSERSGS